MIFKKAYIKALLLAALFVTSFYCNAQALSFLGGIKSKGGPNKPTVIDCNGMDMDGSKNTIIFNGNVHIDDNDLEIWCDKMTIVLFDAPAKNAKNKNETTKKVEKIVCDGNVEIMRKVYDAEELKKGRQVATGDNAVYEMITGKITLTGGPPKISRGKDALVAKDQIIIWRNSQKMQTKGRTRIIIDGAGSMISKKNTEDKTESSGN